MRVPGDKTSGMARDGPLQLCSHIWKSAVRSLDSALVSSFLLTKEKEGCWGWNSC